MREQTLVERLRLYLLSLVAIRRHYGLHLSLERLARALGSSPRQLQRAFAQFGGRGFHAELHEQRMAVAAQLLSEGEHSVAEVARLVGYRHVQSFVVAFRRRYGSSPGRYRARAREWRARAGCGGGCAQAGE